MSNVIRLFTKEPTHLHKYDNPDNTIWVLGVDCDCRVFIIDPPNINPSFFINGSLSEDVGLPFFYDIEPGVYKATCKLHKGGIGKWKFEITEMEPYFKISQVNTYDN